jgi:hypothetical protein
MSKLKMAVGLRACVGAFAAAVVAICVLPSVASAAVPTFCNAFTQPFTFTANVPANNVSVFEEDVCFIDTNGGTNTINLPAGTYLPTATVAFQLGTTTINGPSTGFGLTSEAQLLGSNVAPAPADFVDVSHGASLDLVDIEFGAGGNPGTNGAINNSGTVTVDHTTLDGNPGVNLINGSGATATVTDSTVAASQDFGIENQGTLNLIQSTVAWNLGGGISNTGTMHLTNSIVADNTAATSGGVADCTGTKAASSDHSINSDGTCITGSTAATLNLVNSLGSTVPDGGTTPGFPLGAGSTSALGQGDPATCLPADQRGLLFAIPCDIGAIANRQGPDAVTSFNSTAPSNAVVGSTYTPAALSLGGLPATFYVDGSSTPGACTANGAHTTITFNNVVGGHCVIDAVSFGNSYLSPTYFNTIPSQTVTIAAKATQTVTFTSTAPTSPLPGSTYSPTATASSGLTPVTFVIDGSSTAGACTISGNAPNQVVLFHNVPGGSCVIDAVQFGSATVFPSYLPSGVTPSEMQTITVG